MDRLILSREMYEEIIAHAREGYPEEVCGLISGRLTDNVGRATALYRARNVAEDREVNYTVDPHTLLKQMEFEERGEMLIAIYHSHPVSPPYPSATDARQAYYPDAVYIICSLQDWDHPVMRGWHLVQEEPQPLERLPEDAPPVAGRRGLWARHTALGPGRARYELWWQENGTFWTQTVHVQEVPLDIEA